jgi:hypothetical protein
MDPGMQCCGDSLGMLWMDKAVLNTVPQYKISGNNRVHFVRLNIVTCIPNSRNYTEFG